MRYDLQVPMQCSQTRAEVTHVYIYAKDVYSFNDEKPASQYLGHWNRHGVIISLDSYAATLVKQEAADTSEIFLPPVPKNLDKPLDTGSSLLAKQVFYPVKNKDFQNWRYLKKRGGDFAIFSNLRRVKLAKPIVMELEEVCKPYRR